MHLFSDPDIILHMLQLCDAGCRLIAITQFPHRTLWRYTNVVLLLLLMLRHVTKRGVYESNQTNFQKISKRDLSKNPVDSDIVAYVQQYT